MSRSIGNEAEDKAVEALEADGYEIVERNYTCRAGEIDVVTQKDGYYCFVEVKFRNYRGYGTAIDSITKSKMRKILFTAKRYLYENDKSDADYRIDAVILDGNNVEILSDIYTEGMS